jgi:hypothetical protein
VTSQYQAERAAYKSFDRLLDEAEACQQLFLDAGVAIPEPLKRLLAEQAQPTSSPASAIPHSQKLEPAPPPLLLSPQRPRRSWSSRRHPKPLPMPDHGPVPAGFKPNWISLPASSASPYSLTLAVLRSHMNQASPISIATLNREVAEIRGLKGSGAAYNVVIRLEKEGLVQKTETGVRLKSDKGGTISGKRLWASQEDLNEYDYAAYRREVILLLLKENPELTTTEIARGLEVCQWVQIPKNKDLVKADMNALEKEGHVLRLENKDWVLKTNRKEAPEGAPL